jgi:hypothetical protein
MDCSWLRCNGDNEHARAIDGENCWHDNVTAAEGRWIKVLWTSVTLGGGVRPQGGN